MSAGVLSRPAARWLGRSVGRRVLAVVDASSPLPPPPFMVAANHLSFFDHALLIWWAGRQGWPALRFLSKAEQFRRPVAGRLHRAFGGIPISRGAVDTDAWSVARQSLAEGGIVVVYPEGTRSRSGDLAAFRTGAASLAAAAQVPTIPVGLLGTKEVLPVGGRWPRRGRRAMLRVGAPLPPPAVGRSAGRVWVRGLFQQVAALTGQWPAESVDSAVRDRFAWGRPPLSPAAERLAACTEHAAAHGLGERDAWIRPLWAALREDASLSVEWGRWLGQRALGKGGGLPQGLMFLETGRWLRRGAQARPTDAVAWHACAVWLEHRPGRWARPEEALALHRLAASLAPTSSRILAGLAEALEKAGRPEEARRVASAALSVDPTLPARRRCRLDALLLPAARRGAL